MADASMRWFDSQSRKFGMTRMSLDTPSSRYVSALRLSDTAVTPSDCSMPKRDDLRVRAVAAEQRDVRAVQRRDHARARRGTCRDARICRARYAAVGVRNRVVRVNDVEPLARGHLDDLVRERQQILRLAEQRIARRLDAMERQARLVVAEPNGRVAAQDVDAVAARRQRLPSSVAMMPLPPTEA